MKKEGDLPRSAIMLLAFGGPRSLDEVAAFVEQLIGKKPFPEQLVELQQRYQAIGGASPLPETTMRQARALEQALKQKGTPFPVFVGMRYGHPLIAETLGEIKKRGITRLILVSLSPYRTPFSSAGFYAEVKRITTAWNEDVKLVEVDDWYAHPSLCAAWATKINKAIEMMGARKDEIPVVFTAHSLPQEVAASSSYVRQLEETIAGIIKIAGPLHWRLAFQSKGRGKEAWLAPEPEAMFKELAAQGCHQVLICPIGFIVDHLETLYDLDIVLKAEADKQGIEINRVPCLNDAPELIEALVQLVEAALEKK
jgi:ferrochelatase